MSDEGLRKRLVMDAIRLGARELSEIARDAGGIYPSELTALLELLVADGAIELCEGRYEDPEAVVRVKKSLDSEAPRCDLPLPHPHDGDWRFHSRTAGLLAREVLSRVPRDGRVVLLGTPRLFVELCLLRDAEGYEDVAIQLLDSNSAAIEAIEGHPLPTGCRAVYRDLFAQVSEDELTHADVVVCDPPWYPEHYEVFLAHASAVGSIGSTVLVSLLPTGARPGAVDDRWSIMHRAAELGLHVESIGRAALTYETPAFERRSLLSQGHEVVDDWRPADLLVLRKSQEVSDELREHVLEEARLRHRESEAWLEVVIEGRKLKLRGPLGTPEEGPALLSIEVNDTLPTVSRRYPGREHVDLWLWDNRVFGVRGKAALWAALCEMRGAGTSIPIVEVAPELLARARRLIEGVLERS